MKNLPPKKLYLLLFTLFAGCASAPSIPQNQNLKAPQTTSYIDLSKEVSFVHEFGGAFNIKRTWFLPAGRYVSVAENDLGTYYQKEDSTVRFKETGMIEEWPGGIYINKTNDLKQVYYYPKKGIGPIIPLAYMLSPHGDVPTPSSIIPDEISQTILVVRGSTSNK